MNKRKKKILLEATVALISVTSISILVSATKKEEVEYVIDPIKVESQYKDFTISTLLLPDEFTIDDEGKGHYITEATTENNRTKMAIACAASGTLFGIILPPLVKDTLSLTRKKNNNNM